MMANTRDDSPHPYRLVLERVPRVGFYPDVIEHEKRCPEDIPFPSCLRAVLEHLGEYTGCKHCREQDPEWALGCTYAHLLGVSGAAFFFGWGPGWAMDNLAIHHMSDDPMAPFARTFEAIGYGYEIIQKGPGHDMARFRQGIMESIHAHGRPVIAFGVVGPHEPCIIAGYDEDGKVLIGWSFFQGFPEFTDGVEFEPSGYFRKREWFKDTHAIILIGEKGKRPTYAETSRSTLEWALKVMRTPVTCSNRSNGLAAYAAWAEALAYDAEFEAGAPALRGMHVAHDDAVGYLAEARWYGSIFMAQIAQREWKASDELYRAAACFAAEHSLMWDIWAAVGGHGHGDERVQAFAKPEVRKQIVDVIHQAVARDAEAARWIERAIPKIE